MNHGELKKKLKQIGCYKVGEGKRHERWYSPLTNDEFPVGRHNQKEVPSGTLKSIMNSSGLKL